MGSIGVAWSLVHADLQRLLARDLLPDITAVPLDDLRQLRVECSATEGDVSFIRRVVQGRLDIVGHEHRRRTGADDELPDVAALLFDLPDILSEGNGSGGRRQIAIHQPGAVAQALVGELDQIASPTQLTSLDRTDEVQLTDLFDQLRSFEVQLSSLRHRLHERIDAIQSEIARRYRDGEASIDSLLN
jgi:hypothetical protein